MRPPRKRRTLRRRFQKLWLRFDRQSLTFKLLLLVLPGFTILVVSGSLALHLVSRDAIARMSVSDALYKAQFVRANMIEFLLKHGPGAEPMDRQLAEISRTHELETVNVYDRIGRIAYSANPAKRGELLDLRVKPSSRLMSDGAVINPDEERGYRGLQIILPIDVGDTWTGGAEIRISLEPVYREFAMNRFAILALAFVLMLFGAILIRWMIHRIVRRPIKKFVRVIKRTARGEFKLRPHIHEDPDLRRLAIHFSGMIREIEKAQKELEIQYRHELHQANRLASLGHYISRISHEIKNPLAAISAALFAFEGEFRSRGGDEVFEEVCLKIKHIEQTVTNLLRYARQAPPAFESCRIERSLQQALQFAAHLIERHQIRVRWDLEENLPSVRADEGQLQQVFLNLILNAVYAMGDKGLLTFSARSGKKEETDGAEVVVTIRDTGSGMGSEQIEEIFKPFYSTRKGGTGLGLSVVKTILESHEGRIDVSSVLEKGTVITVSLPAAVQAEYTQEEALTGYQA